MGVVDFFFIGFGKVKQTPAALNSEKGRRGMVGGEGGMGLVSLPSDLQSLAFRLSPFLYYRE